MYFRWLDCHVPEKSVYIFQRGIGKGVVIATFNFSDRKWEDYSCPLQRDVQVEEVLGSDWMIYGGQTQVAQNGRICCSLQGRHPVLLLTLSALSARIFQVM